MTCVAALVSDDTIYMAGDSCASTETTSFVVGNPKVFLVDNTFLIGASGSFRMIDLLRYCLDADAQENSQSDDAYMRTTFIGAIADLVAEADLDDNLDWEIIVGYRGKLYRIQDDLSVLDLPEWGHAIGNGSMPALGSLHSTVGAEPTTRLRKALEASEAVCPSVRGPFLSLMLAPDIQVGLVG